MTQLELMTTPYGTRLVIRCLVVGELAVRGAPTALRPHAAVPAVPVRHFVLAAGDVLVLRDHDAALRMFTFEDRCGSLVSLPAQTVGGKFLALCLDRAPAPASSTCAAGCPVVPPAPGARFPLPCPACGEPFALYLSFSRDDVREHGCPGRAGR